MLAGVYPCTPRQFFSGNASLSRARFLEAGGFDPTFRRAEDLEFAYRMRDRGATFIFNPRADVKHYASRTFESWCRVPYQYGRYEVAMHRDKGHESFWLAIREFHQRHPLNQLVARVCVGRPLLLRAATHAVHGFVNVADAARVRKPAILALSGLFNILYWQGVADECGGTEQVWRAVEHAAAA
jgi:GT2 family glycosyltransferase